MAIHERVWERADPPSRRMGFAGFAAPAKPVATYTLLALMLGVYIVEQVLYRSDIASFARLFLISTDWYLRPWTLVTSTLAHDPVNVWHLLGNALFLFFFGRLVERLVGLRTYVLLFFAGGALSGVLQVHLSAWYYHEPSFALGASGALMLLFGILMVVMPNERLLLYGIIPVPFWAAGIGYALLDVLGIFQPSGIGNFAHLAGLALGLAYGLRLRQGIRVR